MNTNNPTVAPVVAGSLNPVSTPWTKEQAAHLLRRTLMGPKLEEIEAAYSAGLSATLDQLFDTPPAPAPPVNTLHPDDPNVPIGATWINAPHLADGTAGSYRYPSLRGWYIQNLIDGPTSIRDRLTLFWANHFGMSRVNEHRAEYQYITLFQESGSGSYKTMIERITVHPSMLAFLNGVTSHKWSPNENYARELLELFTIHKGPQIGPGDYTNYTEEDIVVCARVLTGWQIQGFYSTDDIPVESYFTPSRHHEGVNPDTHEPESKQLSAHFGNTVITNDGENEYLQLIDIIFQQPETARAMCRSLYRYFVYSEIDDIIETDIIEPLAQHMINHDFSIEMTLRLLFSSEHFFHMSVRGPIIKSPYDFVISILRPMGGFAHLNLSLVHGHDLLRTTYDLGLRIHWWLVTMNMDILHPPTVAGWKAYYQVPSFYRNWISSSTLQRRQDFVGYITNAGIYSLTEGDGYDPRPLNWLGWVDALGGLAYDVNEVVGAAVTTFLPRPLDSENIQFDTLKAYLTRGINDEEWVLQYSAYRQAPDNPMVAGPVRNSVKDFFKALFSMAEFQLQ